MERIELVHSAKRAYRWLANGVALPMPWDEAQKRIARGLATEVVE